MTKGGSICNRLKFIRKRLAEQNGIDYKVERCPNSGNCQEGTCPFCEKEADDLSAMLLEKEARGEKVVWDVSIDDYDPSTLYGDKIELVGEEVIFHDDIEFGKIAIPPIDLSINHIDPSTLEKIALQTTTMGMCSERMEMPDTLKVQVDGMVDMPAFVNPDMELQGYAPNPNKTIKVPDFKTVDVPWFDIVNDSHNEKQDSSISSEKPLTETVSIKDVLPEAEGVDYDTLFNQPLMGDVQIPKEMRPIAEVKLATIDDSDWMVKTDPRDLDEDTDESLTALQEINRRTGAKFTLCLNVYLREGKDVERAVQYLCTYEGCEDKEKPEEKSENAETRTVPDDFVEDKVIPITVEAIRTVRQATANGLGYCKKMLQKCGGHIDKAIEEIKKHPERRPLMGKVRRDDD